MSYNTRNRSEIRVSSKIDRTALNRDTLLSAVIDLENSRHLLNQSDSKLKPVAILSPRFRRLLIFTFISQWLHVIFFFVLIGWFDCFTTLNQNKKQRLSLQTGFPI